MPTLNQLAEPVVEDDVGADKEPHGLHPMDYPGDGLKDLRSRNVGAIRKLILDKMPRQFARKPRES